MDEETKFVVKFGCGSTVGGRPYQEDRLVATRLNGSADQTFFAVFDGHGGDRCSEFLSKSFYKALLNHPKFSSLPIVALQETWASFDEKCLAQLKQLEACDPKRILPGDGSTATACVIISNDIYITNCGDSAAYTIHQDGRTELLTEDHGTNNPEEVARCVKAGGELKPQFYTQPYPFPLCFLHRSKAAKPRMLPGGLLVTRSFGDFNSKLEYLGGKKGVVVSSHGRISYINAAKSPPKYLILASDGVWDVLSIEEVSNMIDQYFLKRTFESRPSASSNPSNVVSDPPTRAKNSPVVTPRKNSPHKVFPETATGSVTDLAEPPCTASLVESELINARYTDLDADLNELSTMIVNAAASSPKWKTLGMSRLYFRRKKRM
jgi:serine/threonine protein phosphatase PrpC